ncbi:hypothetical protein BTO30_13855 [Domibacillus antri]|uniref:Uncharacterized protein n=1 Tax=Domibacillus antri TaxID=1714264 RepID=A0A1Q8Q2W8_9BACI|nr:hypothetical protein [Domibacillus antri]OLN21645.1 hypothetical protein BTO30_13855 [Domibacillus antri]
MTIEQIKLDIDQLEKSLCLNSLHSLDVEVLEQLQEKVKDLKEAFLETSFVGYMIEELEEIRFKLAEITVGIEIRIKEKLHQDITVHIRKLESLYRTA